MSRIAAISSAARPRIRRAEAWLEIRATAEELLIVGATLDAANELARKIAKKKEPRSGGIVSLCQLAFVVAAPFWLLAV
jgi:hypothetical protein